MAAEPGSVIACHAKDEFDAQMAKAKAAGKLVGGSELAAIYLSI